MPPPRQYRIYLLDGNFRVCVAHDVVCPDDDAACETAAKLSKDRWWELWRGKERIRRGKGYLHVPAEPLQ